jgi:hypothetical protein
MKDSRAKDSERQAAYRPSAEEIEQACAKIQQQWSVRQRDKRAGRVSDNNWTPPRIEWDSISEAISDSQTDGTGSGWLDSGR